MVREIDNFFAEHDEPMRSSLLALRDFILHFKEGIIEKWMYKMPFYYYKGKRFCYIWTDKKRNQPYVGIVDGKDIVHTQLIAEKRSRMKILLIDPNEDLPVKTISVILMAAIELVEKNVAVK